MRVTASLDARRASSSRCRLITSIAKSLGARRVASEALAWTRRHPVESVVVSDRSALHACVRFAQRSECSSNPHAARRWRSSMRIIRRSVMQRASPSSYAVASAVDDVLRELAGIP